MSGEAPGGEGKTCPGCGGLGWIPAGDEQLGCCDCNGTGHAAAPPPRPAQDAVREAAETISRIYFEIAAEAVGEEWVRAEFKRRLAALLAAISSARSAAPAMLKEVANG